jgi:hypothetical protein
MQLEVEPLKDSLQNALENENLLEVDSASIQKPKKERPKLKKLEDEDLMGENGFSALMRNIKNVNNLQNIMQVIQLWGHDLMPKLTTSEFLDTVERQCTKKRMRIYKEEIMRGWKRNKGAMRDSFVPTVPQQQIDETAEIDVQAAEETRVSQEISRNQALEDEFEAEWENFDNVESALSPEKNETPIADESKVCIELMSRMISWNKRNVHWLY